MNESNNKRVAKNAIALTIRMIIATIVGLYTSRVVLETLGDIDYGIYGVVGGIVGLVTFLNSAMAGATSRFITYELGKKNNHRMQEIFNTAFWIHFGIAIIVMMLSETIGLWFLNNKMVIPSDKMVAANILFQFSVFSVIISFTQVPYKADIIAHEKMNIYAYFEIVNVICKLLIVYVLLIVQNNRLILYGSLVFAVHIIIALSYRVYCIRKFEEAHISFSLDKKVAHKMLAFTSFDLYGNMCATAKTQGQPIILNLFFGVLANTGSSIALTVSGSLNSLTSGISQAFRPQIIKSFAANEIDQMQTLMRRSSQFSILAFGGLSIPFILLTPQILYLWLGQVPEYSVQFLRLIILGTMLNTIIMISNTSIHATGNIKNISFINGSFYLLCPILSYFLYKLGANIYATYILDIIILGIIMCSGWIINKYQIPQFRLKRYIFSILRSLFSFGLSLLIVWFLKNRCSFLNPNYINESWYRIIFSVLILSIISIIIDLFITSVIALNKNERNIIQNKIRSFFSKIIEII